MMVRQALLVLMCIIEEGYHTRKVVFVLPILKGGWFMYGHYELYYTILYNDIFTHT
jgi:hypothetical protein